MANLWHQEQRTVRFLNTMDGLSPYEFINRQQQKTTPAILLAVKHGHGTDPAVFACVTQPHFHRRSGKPLQIPRFVIEGK